MKQVQTPKISWTLRYEKNIEAISFSYSPLFLNILYFIIPTKNPILIPPPKKNRRTKTTHHTKIHICLARHQLVSRRGTQVRVASRRCLPHSWWVFPQQTHGENPTSKMDQPFRVVRLGGNPPISGNTQNMQIGFRVLESICMIRPRLKTIILKLMLLFDGFFGYARS